MVIDYSYNSRGDRVKKATTYSFSLMSVDTYRILRYDDRGNWIEREVLHRSTDDNGKLGNGTVTKETREILYFTPATPTGDSSPAAGTDNSDWASLRESLIGKRITPQSPTSAEGWQALIGKRLSLTTYGISQNGQEANRFECQTGRIHRTRQRRSTALGKPVRRQHLLPLPNRRQTHIPHPNLGQRDRRQVVRTDPPKRRPHQDREQPGHLSLLPHRQLRGSR